MAKRPRRRAIVLESDDEEEGDGRRSPPRDSGSLPVISSVQETGAKSDTGSRRKLQKLETSAQTRLQEPSQLPAVNKRKLQKFETRAQTKLQEQSQVPAVNRASEAGRKRSRKNVSHGTFPLKIITKKAVSTQESSQSRKGRAPAKPEDDQKSNVTHEVDHRLWVDKYAPRSVGELVVHTKKVAEVKEWLQGQLVHPYGSSSGSRVLVLTGPAGVGKTAVVHVLAEVLGAELFEWTTPVPELWQEYSHHAASGGPYVSKLDEFEAFLERGRKMSSLPIVRVPLPTSQTVRQFSGDGGVTSSEKGAKVLVIDDLPIVNDREHKQRLAKSLFQLALSRDFPTIVVITDEIGTGVRLEERDHQHKDVLDALERGGAKKIAFNPVTVNAMKKLLTKVQLLEKCRLSSESVSAIAESSAGDIRQALTSLQFLCLGYNPHNPHHLLWDPGGLGSSQVDPRNHHTKSTDLYASVGGGRDYSLSLFHALGKFLHNKRLTDEHFHTGTSTVSLLKEEFRRYPLDMEEPEVILSQAHTEPAKILAFLHENVLQFIDEDATDDVAVVSKYLSDTDCLLGAQGSFRVRNNFIDSNDVDPSQIATVVANSVAARGVLFGNGHPAPRRWQSLRAPALWQIERQNKLKKMEMSIQGANGMFNAREYSGLVKAVGLYPFSHHLSKQNFSCSSPSSFTNSHNVDVDHPMHVDEHDPNPRFQHDKQEPFGLETNLMKMCVEDDIEDPDD